MTEVPQTPGGTPKRRRKSAAARPEAADVESVAQVHELEARQEVTVKCVLLLADDATHKAEVKGRKSGQMEKKAVCNLLVADASGMLQVTLWGEAATTFLPKAQEWLEQAEDGKFPVVKMKSMQVAAYRNKTVPRLVRLQSTGRSKVETCGSPSVVVVRPPPSMLLQKATVLRQPGVTTCVRGVVDELREMAWSQDGTPMRGFQLATEDQWRIPCMLHGSVAEEEPLKNGMKVIMFFAETKAPLEERREDGGLLWLYSSGFLLLCGPAEGPVSGRQLRIGQPDTTQEDPASPSGGEEEQETAEG